MRVTDSEQSTDEICIDARVAAVFAGLDFALSHAQGSSPRATRSSGLWRILIGIELPARGANPPSSPTKATPQKPTAASGGLVPHQDTLRRSTGPENRMMNNIARRWHTIDEDGSGQRRDSLAPRRRAAEATATTVFG